MNEKHHHLQCLGVMATLYNKAKDRMCQTDLDANDMAAIEGAIDSAEKIGLPVSGKLLREGKPICVIPPSKQN